jgi:hypothetical protein
MTVNKSNESEGPVSGIQAIEYSGVTSEVVSVDGSDVAPGKLRTYHGPGSTAVVAVASAVDGTPLVVGCGAVTTSVEVVTDAETVGASVPGGTLPEFVGVSEPQATAAIPSASTAKC